MSALLELEQVDVHFPLPNRRRLGALNGVSLALEQGEVLGIVGESGCGKTTLARVMMGIQPPTKGRVLYQGKEVCLRSTAERRAYARQVQMIFQNPYSSLNPRSKVGEIVGEGLLIHQSLSTAARRERVGELLSMVGLRPEYAERYPHEFSGGQRQRIGIARALAISPRCLICDEPISALDVSVQAQVINLLQALQKQMGLTILFIAHDLKIVRYFCDRIAVMYLGQVVESSDTEALCQAPLHPYTKMLLDAVLTLQPNVALLQKPVGEAIEPTSPILPIIGCSFAKRCPWCVERCHRETPVLQERFPGRWVACHRS